MELAKTNRMNALFEFYEALLTEKQQNYMQLYYGDDYSLGEIAEEFEVSRQAVYDNIKRTAHILESYEAKLHLLEHFQQQNDAIEKIMDYVTAHYQEDSQLLSLVKVLQEELAEEDE
ncbi:putative DNA-binding protein [Isobaculum melis]|uniref:UPF0122 protein SAMN04488559_110116 n=1 Tax=Isobaculum melis TaxID=142588 RepID=A0A1H9T4S2_9LACT|nr:putative DNA-binding protein [Isobaculum melis]SER91964.1 hypothetical protein SAMN04488559_110116 [Isobaculum melis]